MSNITINRVKTTFSATETTNLEAAHATYSSIIDSKMVTLTDEEASRLKGVDVVNAVFVMDVIKANDAEGVGMMPPAVAALAPELVKDNTFLDQLDKEEKWLLEELEKIRQTKKVVADEAYSVSLVFYNQYKTLADAGIPGAKGKYQQLKGRFEGTHIGRPTAKPI